MKFEVKWKREKKERNFLIVLSIVFAVFWVLGNYEVLGFSGLSLICVCTARVILYSIILYILLGIIWDKILAFEMMDSKEERKKSKKLYWGIVGICLICWLPYFLTLYPGVVTWDSEWQVEQAIGVSSYSNHQPWIQTLMSTDLCLCHLLSVSERDKKNISDWLSDFLCSFSNQCVLCCDNVERRAYGSNSPFVFCDFVENGVQ